VNKLMNSLVRYSQQAGRIARAHFQLPAAQQAHRATRRKRGTLVFTIGLLTQGGV
jgi:hypothetical protein